MSLQRIKKEVYQNLEELFAFAALDEMADDTPAYQKKLETIAQIAEPLGIDTEITTVSIDLKK